MFLEKINQSKTERAEKRAKKRYEKKYGEGTWVNRLFAERLIQRMKQENKYLYRSFQHLRFEEDSEEEYGYNNWVRLIVKGDKWSVPELFTAFKKRYESLENTGLGIEKYDWLNEFSYEFEESELELMIVFQDLFWQLASEKSILDEIAKELKNNGICLEEHEGFKKAELAIQDTLCQMEELLNPVTKKFNDSTSIEDELNAKVDLKVKAMMGMKVELQENKLESGIEEQTHSLESIRKLNEVLNNEKVSSDTKEKVKNTILEIEESLVSEKEQIEREQAELEAEAILQASKIVHNLKGQNSKGVY